ncbi:MAG: vWA domain-containing protein, partial [Limisphaerales bacterium]
HLPRGSLAQTIAPRGGLGMNFLAPAAFAFAAAIPVVVVFYLLKRKRVVKLVSSTLLWQRFLSETQASAPFQRLRKNWLLILQIILLALAVLALSRPYFAARMKAAQLRVVILDASASMQATDEKPSRFEAARAEALKWVDSLAGSDQMVILQAGVNTEVKQSASAEKAALRRALQACVCSDGPTRLVPALRMAESLVRDQRGAEIHLFSDGAVPDLSEFENKALPLIYHPVGKSSNNVGITALDVRANPEDSRQRAVYVSVANFSSNSVQTDLELRLDDRLIETRPLMLPAGEVSPQVFLAAQQRDGVFTLRLTGQDDLNADNQASIVSLLPKPVKVLLVTRGNRLLEKALRSAANVELALSNDLTDSAVGFDFVVLDGITPGVWPKGNVLAIHVVNTNWLPEVTRIQGPALVDWRSTHPLLRYAGFDNVQVAESLAAKTPNWAVSLLDAPQAPLMLAGEIGRQRIIWIGFDILESNWPLRVSFPIFIANAVEWLNPANAQGGQLLVKAGEAFRLPLLRPEKTAEVTPPDGRARTLNLDANANEFVFGDTYKQGIYHLRLGTNETTFCVDLLDSAESNIKPRDELQLGKYTRVTATRMQRANMELWRTIAGIGLMVLLGEWWYYHRRTV